MSPPSQIAFINFCPTTLSSAPKNTSLGVTNLSSRLLMNVVNRVATSGPTEPSPIIWIIGRESSNDLNELIQLKNVVIDLGFTFSFITSGFINMKLIERVSIPLPSAHLAQTSASHFISTDMNLVF